MSIKPHILFHRPTPWESDVQCSTKVLAGKFAEIGYDVTYLEDPMDVGHLIKWKGYFHVWKRAPRWEGLIWIINPFSCIPCRDFFPFNSKLAADLKYKSCIPSIKSLIKRSGRRSPEIIWTTVPGSRSLADQFPDALFLFHVIDYYRAFRGDYVERLEKSDYEAGNHIFLIGNSMIPYLKNDLGITEDKITVLGQGVSLDKYEQCVDEPDDIAITPRPRAIWCGVTEKGDEGLFRAAAAHMGELGGSIIFVGAECDWLSMLKNDFPEIIQVLGPKPPSEVPFYLLSSDIGLMLYDRTKAEVYEGQNPLKLYEYAAAGLSIISTPHAEYAYTNPPVIQVREEPDIPQAINYAIRNREVMKGNSLDFASENSWDSIVERIRAVIKDLKCASPDIVQHPNLELGDSPIVSKKLAVSVVIPTFDRAHMISDALNSIVAQTYRPQEIVVIDDGSNDCTADMIERWQKDNTFEVRLKYLKQSNLGANSARNLGIKESSGDFIAFLDSDDLWHPFKLEKQMEVFCHDPAVGAVYCGLQHVEAETGEVIELMRHSYLQGDILEQMLVSDVTAPTSTFVVRKDVFEQSGYFDVGLSARQDWDMWIRVASVCKIGCVPEVLIDLRDHAGSRTATDPDREIRAYTAIMEKYSELRERSHFSVRRAAHAAFYRRIGRVHLHYKKDKASALQYYLKAVVAWPFVFDSYAALAGVFLPQKLRGQIHRFWNRLFGNTRLAIKSH